MERKYPYTSHLFDNHRYDLLQGIVAGVISLSVIVLFVAWCFCII